MKIQGSQPSQPLTSKATSPKEKAAQPASQAQTNQIWNPDLHKTNPLPQGKADLNTSLYQDTPFKLERHPDGGATVHFPRGQSPSVLSVVGEMFPNAKEVKILNVDSTHPFLKTNFEVDGKPYHADLLTGGIVASSSMEIRPGFFKPLGLPKFPQETKSPPLKAPGELFEPTQVGPMDHTKTKNEPVLVNGQRVTPAANHHPFEIKAHGDKWIADGPEYFPGSHPPVEEAMLQAFPNAQNITLVSENHQHPFNTYTFDVDGKSYQAQFLFGGIVASKGLSISEVK